MLDLLGIILGCSQCERCGVMLREGEACGCVSPVAGGASDSDEPEDGEPLPDDFEGDPGGA